MKKLSLILGSIFLMLLIISPEAEADAKTLDNTNKLKQEFVEHQSSPHTIALEWGDKDD